MKDNLAIGACIVGFWFFLAGMFLTQTFVRFLCLVGAFLCMRYGIYLHSTKGWRELDRV
jgi:hypothetical protein